jgi:CBS domain-containing protein
MPLKYNVIEIFTSEEARWKGKPVPTGIIEHVRKARIAARCLVTKGVAGCYENGEVASSRLEVLSFNMPMKIEIILPAAELEKILPGIEEIVTDGIVVVEDMEIKSHRAEKHLIPRRLMVRDVMTGNPKSITVSTPAADIIKILMNANFHCLPVTDNDNRPTGIITQGDLISRAGMPVRLGMLSGFERKKTENFLESVSGKKAGEIMTSPVKTTGQDKPLVEAVNEMLKHSLKRMPVVDTEGRLAGILSRFDIFRTITSESPDWKSMELMSVKIGNIRRVEDIMQRDTDTVLPDTPVADISRIIDSRFMQRVIVTDKDGKLLGMISDRDLLSMFAGHHAGIWDYLMAKMPFNELAAKHREFIRQAKLKTAANVMKTDLVTVKEKTPVDEAIKLMAEKKIKRLPVVDDNGIFKGMVSRDSVLRAGIK